MGFIAFFFYHQSTRLSPDLHYALAVVVRWWTRSAVPLRNLMDAIDNSFGYTMERSEPIALG